MHSLAFAPLVGYILLALCLGRGIVRLLYSPGEMTLKEGAFFVLPLALFAPLPVLFALNAFAGVAITRLSIVAVVFALAVLTHALPGPDTGAEPEQRTPPLEPDRLARGSAAGQAPPDTALTVLKVVLVSIVLFWTLGPLFSYDLFLYHLPFAEELARTGQLPADVTRSVTDLTRAYPPLVYMGYGVVWVLVGDREHVCPRIIAMGFHIGIVALLFWVAGGAGTGLAAAWLFVASPPFVAFGHIVGTDLPLAYFVLSWALMVRSYLDTGRSGDRWIACLHVAMALWTKYQALGAWAGGFLALAVIPGLERQRRLRLLSAQGASLVLFLPLLVRNALDFGNPVYPALPGVLGGLGMDPWTLKNLVGLVQAHPDLSTLVAGLAILAINPVFWLFGLRFAPGGQPATTSERFLLLTVALFLAQWTVLWIQPLSHPERFLLPVVAIMALLTADRLCGAIEDPGRSAAVLLALAWTFLAVQIAYWISVGWLGCGSFQEPISGFTPTAKGYYRLVGFVLRDCQLLLLATALFRHLKRSGGKPLIMLALAAPLLFQCADRTRWLLQKMSRHGWVAHLRYDPDRTEYRWMDALLPASATLLTIGGLPDLISRPTVPLESSRQRDVWEAGTPEVAIAGLTRRGVTHIFVDEVVASGNPLFRGSALARALGRADLVDRLFVEPGRAAVYRVRE